MKKILMFINTISLLTIALHVSAAVYDPSTLHNSVSRSETVQDLFIKRWEILSEKDFYFDIYGKINWVFGFNVNTINAGTGDTEPTDLRLVRTYGSMTLALPFGSKPTENDPKSFMVAFTTTGFHYGLTKSIEIDRGSAGSETVTDYKHSQFFDDIYAISILYRPYVTIHTGLIFNNEYVPDEDGTMDYSDPVKSYNKKFIALNLYEFMAFSMNIDNGGPETIKAEIGINKPLGLFMNLSSNKIPMVYIGYQRIKAYNDQLFDSVWVDNPKDPSADYSKDSAVLNIYSLKVIQRLSHYFTLEGFYGAQYITEDIYSKSSDRKIDVSKSKEWYILLNLDPVPTPDSFTFKGYTGMSWYWDPAISIHRDNPDKGNAVYGWILGAKADFVMFGADLMVEYNFSSELKKLLETSDKWAVEGSMFFRI